jgi:queuine tRNA-ribosyltransferase
VLEAVPVTKLRIDAVDGAARTGTLATAYGAVQLPAFMPVGTHASVKALHPDEVAACGVDILLCNAYHLALRPGVEVIERAGGLHRFMGWDGAILTDSGGYQLITLAGAALVDDDGAVFVSPYDGSRLRVTPEDAITLQARLGADIIMCLDHPVGWGSDAATTAVATERTHLWAERCRDAHPGDGRLLFGITQGGFDAQARRESAARIAALDFDGNAIGGLSVGEPLDDMITLAEAAISELPADRPRYFMGLGTDAELLAMVSLGVDMFDCVVPTRLARNGTALTPDGRVSLRNATYRDDVRPLDEDCKCPACARFSRAYLRHLFQAQEILAHRLVSIHNITHLARLMDATRAAIRQGTFSLLREAVEGRLEGQVSLAPG